MLKKVFWLFVLVGLTSTVYSAGTKEKQIDIYYSASLNGNLDGCECKGNPRSGLVKRAAFLRTIDKKSSLLLETGDIFDVHEDELLSDYILQSYLELGYDIISIGDQEFSNGKGYLLEKIKEFPLHGNNLSIRTADGRFEKVSEEVKIISREGFDIAVFTMIDPETFRFYPEDMIKAIKVEDPESSIRALLRVSEMVNTDIKVLLYHGSLVKARELARENPSINVIIAGHEQQVMEGEMIGDTILVSPGSDGNMLGHLKVSFSGGELLFENSFISFDYMNDPDDDIIRSRIEEYIKIMTGKLKTR